MNIMRYHAKTIDGRNFYFRSLARCVKFIRINGGTYEGFKAVPREHLPSVLRVQS